MDDEQKTINKVIIVEENGEFKAYLENIPTTCAYGVSKPEAFKNLIILLHGER